VIIFSVTELLNISLSVLVKTGSGVAAGKSADPLFMFSVAFSSVFWA